MGDERRFYEAAAPGARRSAPAALRNREPIAGVLTEWLPPHGLVLEIASGTGEHAVYFAGRFATLEWQPSDVHPDALASLAAWRAETALPNLRPPFVLNAAADAWPIDRADAVVSIKMPSDSCDGGEIAKNSGSYAAVVCINMVHISPWSAALGLLDGSAKALERGGVLVLYGPWLKADIPAAASNVAFDLDIRARDPQWGLRSVEDFEVEAIKRGFELEQVRTMPANNLMLLFRLKS